MGAVFSSMGTPERNGDYAKPALSVFGYGSLLWKPGFDYDHQEKAVLRGFSRRFYQGNTTFRGTDQCPGRVATLVEDDKSSTYGMVYTVIGREKIFAALEHLYEREIENGYYFEIVNVECLQNGAEHRALTCIASVSNTWFLGPPIGPSTNKKRDQQWNQDDEDRKIAFEIARARGQAGPNCEYLFKLADSMRELFPGTVDEDLFRLESYVIAFLEPFE